MPRKPHCPVCGYGETELRGRFAMIALAELNADSYWERLVVGLAKLFAVPPETPL